MGINHACFSHWKMASYVMKFIVLESRIDAVIVLINLLLNLSKQSPQ